MTIDFKEEKQEKKLDELKTREAEALAQTLSIKYGIPYIDLTKFPINTDALRLIPEAEAHEAHLAAFKVVGKELYVAIQSPNQLPTQRVIQELKDKNYQLNVYLASAESLNHAWERYLEISASSKAKSGVIDISDEEIASLLEKLVTTDEIIKMFAEESETSLKTGSISSVLEIMLAGAIKIGASDIHIEPEEADTRLRYRLDGVLHNITTFNKKIYNQILSRVKLISGLKLNIKSNSQDGRFSIKIRDMEIEVRTSMLPGAYGESIVLRILNPETLTIPFEGLGMENRLLEMVNQEIAKPNGLILLTGPTGSGKTTTLYAFLKKINSSETKIITIEDPIEYHLKGINQTQVNREKGYDFLSGLRSALRQDPDVIMVGEIRDEETASIALNAALTGHLVFSTLHTNNAFGVIPRLIDLKINPKILDAALRISIAQRLVRTLCQKCKKTAKADEKNTKMITAVLGAIKEKRPDLAHEWAGEVWVAEGCDACQHTGYKGRLGVFEAIKMDSAVTKLLESNPNEAEIKKASAPQGILDMREDGILKVIAGVTSLDELARVVDLDTDL